MTAARCPSELTGRPTKLDHPHRNRKKTPLFLRLPSPSPVTNFLPFILPLSAVLETPVLLPKKMELTRENINALLSSGSFKEKTSSTFSRGSTQTSGGRGPGKRKKRVIRLRSSPAVEEAHESHLCHSLPLTDFQCCLKVFVSRETGDNCTKAG